MRQTTENEVEGEIRTSDIFDRVSCVNHHIGIVLQNNLFGRVTCIYVEYVSNFVSACSGETHNYCAYNLLINSDLKIEL